MADLPEHEEREIRQYVESQGRDDDDPVVLVQKVGSERILSRVHQLYDVHTQKARWWVITDPTNLYSQEDFPELDIALTFHIGLAIRIVHNSRKEAPEEDEARLAGAWRRFTQALDAMNTASEAADFQAIGVRCREALIAFVQEHADDEWVGELEARPKASDVKGWGTIFSQRLADGRVRAYMSSLVERTWDLTVWLQHYDNATPLDAEFVVDATGHLLQKFGMLIRQREEGPPRRCPRCGSYSLHEDIEVVDESEVDNADEGFLTSDVCRACEWRSEATFTSWAEHFAGVDADHVERYLNSSTRLSDTFDRGSGK